DLAEMLPTKIGWNWAFVSDDIVRGYVDELQQFCEAIVSGNETHSDFDLAHLTTKVIYAAYQSAEEGRRINL
ncbi:MAG: gfo/Idh/MocA family oxidoreductase, partial [Lentisphaeria bacterium]|nr:gfo/Idh/MocA family oxidoreductase [Lentisphaeria bacterium]